MRTIYLPLLIGIAACAAATACSEDPPVDEPPSCPCACKAADPVAHCVNTQNCDTSADCPTGTVCGPLPDTRLPFPEATGADPLAQCGASSPAKRCQMPSGATGRQTLIAGFEVPSFRLLRLESNDGFAAFAWNPPEETHIVHCALFACAPVITESSPDGRTVFQIPNYESCVIASQVFEPGEGVFDLGDPTLAFPPTAQPGPACSTSSPRVVHELLAACWAYDTTKVIAATPLEPLSPTEVFNYQNQFDLDCSAQVDGRTCALGPSLGVCSGGACRPPCVTNNDCVGHETQVDADAGVDADVDAGDAGATNPVNLACVKNEGYVGVCMPATSTRTEVNP